MSSVSSSTANTSDYADSPSNKTKNMPPDVGCQYENLETLSVAPSDGTLVDVTDSTTPHDVGFLLILLILMLYFLKKISLLGVKTSDAIETKSVESEDTSTTVRFYII